MMKVLISTLTARALMETEIWLARGYLQYSTMMLYRDIFNSEKECVPKNMVKEQHK